MDHKIIEVDGRSVLVFRDLEGEEEQQRHVVHVYTWVQQSALYKISAVLDADASAEEAMTNVAQSDEAFARRFLAVADTAVGEQKMLGQDELVAMMERTFFGTAGQ